MAHLGTEPKSHPRNENAIGLLELLLRERSYPQVIFSFIQ